MGNGLGILVLLACFGLGYFAMGKMFGRAKGPAAKGPAAPSMITARPPAAVPPGEEGAWYAVLGVAPESSMELIRAVYQNFARAYRPEEMACFSPGIQQMAVQRLREVTEAYETARRVKMDYMRSWREG